jgi:hypothetical protein
MIALLRTRAPGSIEFQKPFIMLAKTLIVSNRHSFLRPQEASPSPRPSPVCPNGKPAGVPCVQLDEQLRCKIFDQPERPAVCGQLQASTEMCGAEEDGGVHARA